MTREEMIVYIEFVICLYVAIYLIGTLDQLFKDIKLDKNGKIDVITVFKKFFFYLKYWTQYTKEDIKGYIKENRH